MKVYIGIDNGSSGSIGVVRGDSRARFGAIPNKKEQSYTKKSQSVTRIDVVKLTEFIKGEIYNEPAIDQVRSVFNNVFVLIERPMVNPKMFKSTLSAMRALEAVLNVVELLGLPYQYIDSKEWQKALLPQGIQGTTELKQASLQIGQRLFPQIESKHKDRDGLLIAEYARRLGL